MVKDRPAESFYRSSQSEKEVKEKERERRSDKDGKCCGERWAFTSGVAGHSGTPPSPV